MRACLLPPSLLLCVAVFSCPDVSRAEAPVAFGAPFTRHAVLQRDCPLPVWGTAGPGAKIAVSLDGATLETLADADGTWRVTFPPQTRPGLGHSLSLATNGAAAITLRDIAIGDIWLCGGQSNMEMSHGWGLTRGKGEIERTSDKAMRFFVVLHATSYTPLATLQRPCEWAVCGPDANKTFPACGFFFGRALREALPGVPVGLVGACWSGSPVRTWLSEEAYGAVDPAAANEVGKMRVRRDAYEAAGGRAGQRRRMAEWKAGCKAAGDIGAEREDFDDAAWKTVELPQTFEKQFHAGFDGCAWYRRTVTLSAGQAAASGVKLRLGTLDDSDRTYVNGELVGSTAVWGLERVYTLRDGLLREGANVVAVRIDDQGGNGGFTSAKPDALRMTFPGLDSIPLAGEWRGSKGIPYPAKPADGGPGSWTVSACYNAMLHPLFPMAMKGVIWYQGCSDVDRVPLYAKALPALVADWRANFTSPDGLPFYIAQLAPYLKTHPEPVESNWAAMRWLQMQLGETLGQSGTAVLLDVGDHDDIHPKDKKTVGERLARLARVRAYGGEGLADAGPIPLSASVADGKVAVGFKGKPALATADGAAPAGFQLAGEDGRFAWATGAIDGARVLLDIPEGMEPARVRYAWDDYPACNLVGAENLPCGPFELAVER
ncbi:MAG: sialate O-acetylesterase [Kiritimatiellia bacterium]|jgi:sialate O-acetylesterase